MIITILILSLISSVKTQFKEGDQCRIRNFRNTTCKLIDNCPYSKYLLSSNQKRPTLCGYKGNTPIVCCQQIGELANQMCYKYHYGKMKTGGYKGVKAAAKEFTHMASLGYEDRNRIKWLCGGSLISEWFILTAAHCINSSDYGEVQWVLLGDLDLDSTTDDAQPINLKIRKTFTHPQYRPPSHYHDIALIELEKKVIFNQYIQPACIRTTKYLLHNEKLSVTGWGKTDFLGEPSSHLIKIEPHLIPLNQCINHYRTLSTRKLADGIRDDIQICAGHADGRDACEGDSGGPLQIKISGILRDYFHVVGVTSFGKTCGIRNSVGVYVRVFSYIDWIENIVWGR